MTFDSDVAELVIDIEESFVAMDYVPMYEFAWGVRGFKRGHTPDEAIQVCQAAYDRFVTTHRVRRVLAPWPFDPSMMRDIESGVPLDFDLDPETKGEPPIQFLVPVELSTSGG